MWNKHWKNHLILRHNSFSTQRDQAGFGVGYANTRCLSACPFRGCKAACCFSYSHTHTLTRAESRLLGGSSLFSRSQTLSHVCIWRLIFRRTSLPYPILPFVLLLLFLSPPVVHLLFFFLFFPSSSSLRFLFTCSGGWDLFVLLGKLDMHMGQDAAAVWSPLGSTKENKNSTCGRGWFYTLRN